jgi:glycosyltransferase involved in cell wall biosynthesis
MILSSSICFIVGQLGLGGSEKQLFILINDLTKQGWKVSVITLNPGKGDYWEKPLTEIGVTLIKIKPSFLKIKRLIQIIRALRNERSSIIHSWSSYTNFYSAIGGYFAGIPIRLGSERGNPIFSKKSSGKWIYSLSFILLDGLVVNSENTLTILRNKNPRLDIEFIPNGININQKMLTKEQARSILEIPKNCLVIGGIGSLIPRKNFGYLIKIFHDVNQFYPSTKLIIIGDGPDREKLVQQANNILPAGSFLFTGALENANIYMKAIDILCVPSQQEGMPNVVMEALAAGVPVLANNVDAIPLLIEDGINGFTVQVGDEKSFINKVQRLIENPQIRQDFSELGKKRISQYSVHNMSEKFTSYYQKKIIESNNNK